MARPLRDASSPRGGDDLDARSHDGAIKRPAMDVQIDSLTSISSCYQYFMLREGEVLMCTYSCCCPACFNVAVDGNIEGPGKRTYLSCSFNGPYCTHAGNTLYSWRNNSSRPRQVLKRAPQTRGLAIAGTLAAAGKSPGQLVLVEAYGDNDDEMWLGKTVEFSDYGRQSCCTKHTERQRNVCGARLNTRDFMVAMEWHERVPEIGDAA